jgi:signal transduction histidine kinase
VITSFRLRLALLSALLTGLALIAFGLGSWWLIKKLKIERIDTEVRVQAERGLPHIRSMEDWHTVENRLAIDVGARDTNELLLLVQRAPDEELYRSAHWPTALVADQLAWPTPQSAKKVSVLDLPFISSALAQPGPDANHGPPQGRPPPFDRPFPGRPGHPDPRDDLRDAPLPRPEVSPSRPESLPPEPTPLIVTTLPRPSENNSPGTPAAPNIPATRADTSALAPVWAPPPPEFRPSAQAPSAPAPLDPGPPPPTFSAVDTRALDGRLWRIGLATNGQVRIALAVDAHVIDREMNGIRNAFLAALPFALIFIGLASWFFSARALRPLQKLTAVSRRVTATGLSQRISSQGEDREFVELIDVFNRMLGRLERSFKQAHRFSADAAHELKTPLAILQGQLERSIGMAEDGSAMQRGLTSILDEVRRLSTISRKLLLLSQADAGRLSVFGVPFNLSKALDDLLEDTHMLAPQLKVTATIHPDLVITADGSLLRQVLHNLISNAIKYNVNQGWITITTACWSQQVEVRISNSSSGIPAAERSKIFERFYRADPAHSRHVEGVGLGLSVSREIARAHGGDIVLKVENEGTVQFSLLLPSLSR